MGWVSHTDCKPLKARPGTVPALPVVDSLLTFVEWEMMLWRWRTADSEGAVLSHTAESLLHHHGVHSSVFAFNKHHEADEKLKRIFN